MLAKGSSLLALIYRIFDASIKIRMDKQSIYWGGRTAAIVYNHFHYSINSKGLCISSETSEWKKSHFIEAENIWWKSEMGLFWSRWSPKPTFQLCWITRLKNFRKFPLNTKIIKCKFLSKSCELRNCFLIILL